MKQPSNEAKMGEEEVDGRKLKVESDEKRRKTQCGDAPTRSGKLPGEGVPQRGRGELEGNDLITGGPTPVFFVSAHSKGVTGGFFVSAHSKGVISSLECADARASRKCRK